MEAVTFDRRRQFQGGFRILGQRVRHRDDEHPGWSATVLDGENDRARPILGAFLSPLAMLAKP
jgi:hypothetical protein